MQNNCQSNLLLPFAIPGTNCLFEIFSGIVLTVTGSPSPSGLYWNNITGMVNPFQYSNPSNFALQVGDHICMNADDGVITSVLTGQQVTIQYFIGAVPITNPILFTDFSNQGSIQYLIDQAIIDPSTVSITVNSADFSGLDVTVVVNTDTIISDNLVVTINPALQQGSSFSSTFTCNFLPPSGRRTRKVGVCPDEIFLKIGNVNKVLYCKRFYIYIETDQQGLRHYINSQSDISRRGTANWSTLFLNNVTI